MTEPADVREAVEAYGYSFANEAELEDGISEALTRAGIRHVRQARIAPGCIIDVLAGRVGVELKVGGSQGGVRRQLERYLETEALDAIILVTSRARHGMPDEMNGKPVFVVSLAGAGL